MLFTPRLLLVNGQKTTTLRKAPLWGQAVYVVPRADCSFRRVRMAGTGREAKAAAQLRARSEALPGEDGARLVIDQGQSSEGAATQGQSAGLQAGIWNYPTSKIFKGRHLPESLAHIPLANGTRLVHGLSGYEGQIWRHSDLVASRWWGRAPTERDWDGFILAAQESLGPLDEARPAAAQVPWRTDLPIFDIDRARIAEIFSPAHLGAALATLLACGGLYIGGQYLRETMALSAATKSAQALRGGTEKIQSERRRALANMNFVRKYRQLGDNGTILASLSDIAAVVGTTDLGIQRANLRDGTLELRLQGSDEVSVPQVVSALEERPTLSNVNVSLEALGTLIIKADLSPPRGTDPLLAKVQGQTPPADKPQDTPADKEGNTP